MFSSLTYRNPVCKVRFLGWETTTRDLELAGWQLSAEQCYRGTVRLAFYHPVAKLQALTNSVDFRSIIHTYSEQAIMEYGHLLSFDVVTMSHDIRCTYIASTTPFSFKPISAFPEAVDSAYQEGKFLDLVPFRAVNPNAEQIVVAPESVTQVLDLLLKCQAPAAQARRLKERQREVRLASDIQAQVVVEVA